MDTRSRVAAALAALAGMLLAVSCSTTGAHSRASAGRAANGFEVGDVYRVTTAMKGATWAERTYLVPELQVRHPNKHPKRLRDIPPGTLIRVASIRSDNTITHGTESWPEGVVVDGPLKDTRLSLADKRLPGSMQRISGAGD